LCMVDFCQYDWDGFSGAEVGPNGESPLINSPTTPMMIDGMEFAVIVDARGIHMASTYTSTTVTYDLPVTTMAMALLIVRALPSTVDEEVLLELGFQGDIVV
jgi:hypothetical protein